MTAADLIEPTTMRMVPATLDQGMGFDFTKVTRKEWNEIQELLMEKRPLKAENFKNDQHCIEWLTHEQHEVHSIKYGFLENEAFITN